jgi:hypothetical protein
MLEYDLFTFYLSLSRFGSPAVLPLLGLSVRGLLLRGMCWARRMEREMMGVWHVCVLGCMFVFWSVGLNEEGINAASERR